MWIFITFASLAAALFIIASLFVGVYVALIMAGIAVFSVIAFYVVTFFFVLWMFRARDPHAESDHG